MAFPQTSLLTFFKESESKLAKLWDVALLPIVFDEENSKKFEAHLKRISGKKSGGDRYVNFPTITEKAPFAIEELCKQMQESNIRRLASHSLSDLLAMRANRIATEKKAEIPS